MNEEETWLENRSAKKISADSRSAFFLIVGFLGSGDGELAGAPDGMAFSAGADFMVTI